MNNSYLTHGLGGTMPAWFGAFLPVLIVLFLWSIFWKGLALWHSARQGQTRWFLIFLIVNTAGILEIVYLFLILKLKIEELFRR